MKPKASQEQIINQAIQFHLKGNILEAKKLYQYCINLKFKDHRVFSNYGAILQSQGKLQEAEFFYRKAIEINPLYADACCNLGNILRDLGKITEAELYTRKAIEINPCFANAHCNLGFILRDLDKLEEAELHTRKAIKLNPYLSNAYLNLGNTLRDLGKLTEAEISYKKVIKLNPKFTIGYLNLGIVLRELGKLKELIVLLKSNLDLKSINSEEKLIASLHLSISNLIEGDFEEGLLNISKISISEGLLNKTKNKKYKKEIINYFKFLYRLYPLLKKNKNKPNFKIPHFGESHCLSFAHQTISLSSQVTTIQPVLITGGKAWHFANNKHNQWKDSLIQQIKNHHYSEKVFISFGEIDCRKDEGILNYAIKNDKNISEVCEKTIKGYLNYMEKILSSRYSQKYYFGIPAPTREKELLDNLDHKRIKMIKRYNEILKKEVLSRSSYFLDVYELTSTKDGENNNLHMCDRFHLSPKCLSILLKDHLYQS